MQELNIFKEGRLKRQLLNQTLSNFFKFNEANGTGGLLNRSSQKRRQIQENLNRWSKPYGQTGIPFHHPPSASLNFIQQKRSFVPKDKPKIGKSLQQEFYQMDASEIEPSPIKQLESFKDVLEPLIEKQVTPKPPAQTEQQVTNEQQKQTQQLSNGHSDDRPAQIIKPDKPETSRAETFFPPVTNQNNLSQVQQSVQQNEANYQLPIQPIDLIQALPEELTETIKSPKGLSQQVLVNEKINQQINQKLSFIVNQQNEPQIKQQKTGEIQPEIVKPEQSAPNEIDEQDSQLKNTNQKNPRLQQNLTLSMLDRVYQEKIPSPSHITPEQALLNQFQRQHSQKKIRQLAELYVQQFWFHETFRNLSNVIQLHRFIQLQEKVKFRIQNKYFNNLKQYLEYKKQKSKKNQLADSFNKKKSLNYLKEVFFSLRSITQAHRKWIQTVRYQADCNRLVICMKHWKMFWFRNKLKHQIILFRTATLFQSWKRAITKSRLQNDRKVLNFYYKLLLKRSFNLLFQGVMNSKKQKRDLQLSEEFNQQRICRKFFEAWFDVTKNLVDLKENKDCIPVEMRVRNWQDPTSSMIVSRDVTISIAK